LDSREKGAFNGNEFYIPAELDTYVAFAPVRNLGSKVVVTTRKGNFEVTVEIVEKPPIYLSAASAKATIYWRNGSKESLAE